MHVVRGRLTAAAALLLLLAAVSTRGQELSTDVFPSEDELREALRLGEISYEQYLRLLEVTGEGVDSTNLYLLDEIPNLLYFRGRAADLMSGLETAQRQSLVEDTTTTVANAHSITGRIKHRHLQRMERDETSSYRTDIDVRSRRGWRTRLQVERSLGGAERFTRRSVEYRTSHGAVRQVTLGNYTARPGLGLLFGYRGKLLDFDDRVESESFLYPDYGGYNGLYMHAETSPLAVEALISVNRDTCFAIQTVGLAAVWERHPLTPTVLVGVNRLTNRAADRSVDLPAAGLNLRHRYGASYVEGELGLQQAPGGAVWSGVFEGRHRLPDAEISYAGWAYGDRFLDLSAGSKAGNLSRTIEVEDLGFRFSNRRAGQEGGLLRTAIDLGHSWRFSNSLLYAGYNRDHSNTQFGAELGWNASDGLDLEAGYLGTWRDRPNLSQPDEKDQWRLESRFSSGRLSLRSYIGYSRRSDDYSYGSLLVTGRWASRQETMIEFWSNIGRVNSEGIQYWYAFARLQHQLWPQVESSVKLTHTYNRTSDNRSMVQLILEVSASI
jgi:hypothetical protein